MGAYTILHLLPIRVKRFTSVPVLKYAVANCISYSAIHKALLQDSRSRTTKLVGTFRLKNLRRCDRQFCSRCCLVVTAHCCRCRSCSRLCKVVAREAVLVHAGYTFLVASRKMHRCSSRWTWYSCIPSKTATSNGR